MASLAVDADPSVQSPHPLLRSFFFRQSVIDSVGAPDNKKPVSDFVRSAGSVLADAPIDDQFADSERLLLARFSANFYSAPLSQGNCMGFGSGKAAASQQENADKYAGQTHGVANYMTLHQKS